MESGADLARRLGLRLRERRTDLDQTLSDTARQANVSVSYLSAIETGERRVTAEELLRAVELFAVPLETFTDPFLLLGEGQFSWRQTGVAGETLLDLADAPPARTPAQWQR